jgi:protein-tyrosine phosphatase
MGFVDLHCHLLWGVDDGCETPAETLAAARLLVALGFSDAAPSPHAIRELPSGDPALCARRRAEIASLLAAEGIPLALHANAENRLDEEFVSRAGGPSRRGIGERGAWVLVEAPFEGDVPGVLELVRRTGAAGATPLVAHPERCKTFEAPGRVEEVVRAGAALQLNVGALTGVYGRGARRRAEALLDAGLYAVAATDLHSPQGAERWLPEALEVLARRVGPAGVARLLATNPRRILDGERLT